MAGARPLLYFDLGSPYAYLSITRAEGLFGCAPELRPVLLGGIFRLRGHGSWGFGPAREEHQREVQRRAAAYGLPPVRWPEPFPAHTLAAMRATVWAQRQGAGDAFVHAALRRAFAEGEDLADLAVVTAAAEEAGLPIDALPDAIAAPEIKDALRTATDEAWRLGVRGAPWIVVGEQAFYGDDRLHDAAAAWRAAAGTVEA